MDYKKELYGDLKETGALLEGHFVLSSGRHSGTYIQCARLLQYPELAAKYASFIAEEFSGSDIGAVVGPALGGVVLSYEAARRLGARALFAERGQGDRMLLRRGFEISDGEKILIAEDVITTGESVLEVLELVESLGGAPAGICSLIDRSEGRFSPPIRTVSIIGLDAETWAREGCPLCRRGVPSEKPGSRKGRDN